MIPFSDLTAQQERRARLATLIRVCVVALTLVALAMIGPGDAVIAGASSGQSFRQWYSHPENRAWYRFQQWYGASETNAVWFHIRHEFGNGRLGDQAVRVSRCESRHNPRARSHTDDHGLFQINARYHRRTFEQVTGQAWQPGVYHASHNARYARDLYDRQGWGPWVCRGAA